MEPIATELTDEEIGRFAAYYGALTAPRHADLPSAEKAAIQRGRTLARAGDPARGVPPCRVCHDDNALPRYPRLAAQSAPYMAARLHAWRRGNANQHAAGRLMSVIAQRLSDEQVSDASAYFQSLTLGARPGDAP
jgi:cytochrome c553